MLWVVFAIGTAVMEAIKDVLSKRALAELDIYSVGLAMPLFSLPIVIPMFLLQDSVPTLTPVYWIALVSAGSLHVLSLSLYMEALRSSPLAVTLPLISFTPLFMLLTSPFMIGEVPSLLGALGVMLIVSGTYILNIRRIEEGVFEPLKALARDRGARAMFTVAFLWAITGNIDKIGIKASGLLFWAATLCTYVSLGFIPVLWYKGKLSALKTKAFFTRGAAAGFFNALSLICYMEAISLTLVSYVIAVKRTSIIIGILLGYLFLNERDIKDRLLGAVIMVAGVVLISIG